MSPDDLFCPRCYGQPAASPNEWRCHSCGGPFDWRGPDRFDRTDIDESASFIWRYAAALPDVSMRISPADVVTPVASIEIAGTTVHAKLESLHLTGSFKDRGCALMVSALAAQGVERLVEDSSGNAASSLAAYAAHAGIPCTIYAPAAASSGKLVQSAAYGAEVVRISGNRAAVAQAAADRHDPGNGVIYASHNWHPWFIAGVATVALELWEQRGFRAPSAIIAPAGSGSLILGAYAAFSMLVRGGEIERMPRLFAAQPAACAPFAVALDSGAETVTPVQPKPTIAEGASIANPVRGDQVLHAIRSTGGSAMGISEDGIANGVIAAARQGVYIEPTSGLAIEATRLLLEAGTLDSADDIVVILTGNGLKATDAMAGLLNR